MNHDVLNYILQDVNIHHTTYTYITYSYKKYNVGQFKINYFSCSLN